MDQLFARIGVSGIAAWYLTDRLGSVRDMTDNTGALQELLQFLYAECCTRNKAIKAKDIIQFCK